MFKMKLNLFLLIISLLIVLSSTLNDINNDYYEDSKRYNKQPGHDVEVFDVLSSASQSRGGSSSSSTIEKQVTCLFEREGSQVCNCGFKDEDMILPRFHGSVFQVIILNCKTLRIPEKSFTDLTLISYIRMNNIENLILDSYSLMFSRNSHSRIQLEFINTVIEQFSSHAVSGNIENIRLENVRIGVFQPFAITGIRSSLLRFGMIDTSISNIEPQAFKKFSVKDFEIINTTIKSDVPSRSFYEIEVTQNLLIRNSTFSKVHSGAFMFNEVSSFTLANNQFEQLNGESFQMQVRDSINIRNNNFGSFHNAAFQSITIDRNYYSRNSERMIFNFIMNNINMMNGPQQIIFSEQFHMRISQIYYENILTCKLIDNLKRNQFLMLHADTIYFYMSSDDDDEGTNIILLEKSNNDNYTTLSNIINNRCIEKSILIYIIIGICVIVFILLLLLIIIICICVKRRRERRLHVIQPEGKTYRETQIVMQIENHGLLKTDL